MHKIRLKINSDDRSEKISLYTFIEEYFNNFYSEMLIFAGYFSVQEHTNRTQFAEFVSKKLCDLDRLILVLKSIHFYSDLSSSLKNLRNFEYFHQNIIGVADFLSGMFSSMKTGFIPRGDLNMSLSCILSKKQLSKSVFSKKEMIEEENIDYTEIQKMIKIYLLRENLESKLFNHFIKKNLLNIKSSSLNFQIALCGMIDRPEWKLIDASVDLSSTKPFVMAAFATPGENLLNRICKFIKFYENRKTATQIFKRLENPVGFIQNFSGFLNGMKISGKINDLGELKVYSLSGNIIENFEELFNDRKIVSKENIVSNQNQIVLNIGLRFFYFSKSQKLFIGRSPKNLKDFDSKIRFSVSENSKVKIFVESENTQNFDKTIQNFEFQILEKFIFENEKLLELFAELTELEIDASISFIDQYILETKYVKVTFENDIINLKKVTVNLENETINSKINVLCQKNASKSIQLIHIQEFFSKSNNFDFEITKIIDGFEFSFKIGNIDVKIDQNRIQTNYSPLTKDIQKFNFFDGIIFIKNFHNFYKNYSIPSSISENMIVYDFTAFLSENCTVSFVPGNYFLENSKLKLSGLKTRESLMLQNEEIEYKRFHKLYLINRFYKASSFVISRFSGRALKFKTEYSDNQSIEFTPEGLKYNSSLSDAFNSKVSNILNSFREFEWILCSKVEILSNRMNNFED